MEHRRTSWFALTCLLAVLAGCGETHPQPKPQSNGTAVADVDLEPRVVDLGTVLLGSSAPFSAQLVNYGIEPVEIDGLHASCGCMGVSVATKTCQPGERIEITGSIRSGQKPEPFRHSVTVHTAKSVPTALSLLLIGTFQSRFPVTPETVQLSPNFFERTPSQQVVHLQNNSQRTVRLQGPVGLPPGISATLEKHELKPEETTKVVLMAEPVHVTDLRFDMVVSTSDPVEGAITIPVAVLPEQGIKLTPRAIMLGVTSKEALLAKPTLVLNLFSPSLSQCALKRVDAPPFLKLIKKDQRAPDSTDLVFAFTNSFPGCDLRSEIAIFLEESATIPQRSFTLRVPVSGIVNE